MAHVHAPVGSSVNSIEQRVGGGRAQALRIAVGTVVKRNDGDVAQGFSRRDGCEGTRDAPSVAGEAPSGRSHARPRSVALVDAEEVRVGGRKVAGRQFVVPRAVMLVVVGGDQGDQGGLERNAR